MYRSNSRGDSFRVPLKTSPDEFISQEVENSGDINGKHIEVLTVVSATNCVGTQSQYYSDSEYRSSLSQASISAQSQTSSLVEAIAPGTHTGDVNQPEAKRIHLDEELCNAHSNSDDGGKALTQPTHIIKSSKDPNRGLYPRPLRPKVKHDHDPAQPFSVRTHGHREFVKASDMGSAFSASVQARPGQSNTYAPLPVPHLPVLPSSNRGGMAQPQHDTDSYNKGRPPYQKKGKMIESHRNTLNNYFHQSPSQQPSSTPLRQQKDAAESTQAMHMDLLMDYEDISLVEDLRVKDESASNVSSSGQSTRYNSQYGINLPDLPTPNSSFPQNIVEGATQEGTRRKETASSSKAKGTPTKQIGPSSQNLWKSSSDKYGLLGSGNYPASQRDGGGSVFDKLSYEIIENIFSRLPMMDLYLNVNRVCVAWNNIISDTRFLPWKKRYHKLKAGQHQEEQLMQTLLPTLQMTSLDDYIPVLVRYMKNFRKITPTDMDRCLQKHSKYEYAQALVDERFKDCIGEDKVPNSWCIITALVLVSEYASDVQEIYQVLLSSQCSAYVVTECLYCLATFFLKFTNAHRNTPCNGMHYRLYYALYLWENASTMTSNQLQGTASHGGGGQQPLMNYMSGSAVQMSREQLRICNHEIKDGDVIKVIAFAGTGKTMTLVNYTQLRPNLRFLLVVYNKSVQEHAVTKFPGNVTCKTGHALAFQYVGRKYNARNKLGGSALKVMNILNHIRACKGENLYVQAKFIITTLNQFMASADPFITTAHVPEESVDDNNCSKPISHQHRMHYAEQATAVWKKMVDLDNPLKITHDTYLKLYQLQQPKIKDYNVILIDEAQDMTPALADVLINQPQGKILVGDPHQQIYGFRGAVNAMQQLPNSKTFYLTQSFRFGSEIAFVAASCLSILKGEKRKTLVGNASTGSIRGGVEGQLAIITRSNFTLFNEAVNKCCFSDSKETVAFVGGIENFGFDMLLDIHALMGSAHGPRKNIKNKFIARFSTLGELESYATKTSDMELLGKLKIVKAHHHMLPARICKIRSRCISDSDLADVVLTTAHKAKGLEFSTVRLTNDYIVDLSVIIGRGPQVSADEHNILYVAATRAKKRLILSPDLKLVIGHAGELFLYPVLTKKLKAEGVEMKCDYTDGLFDPCALTVVKHIISLGEKCDTGQKYEKLFSPEAVHREMPAVRSLYGRPGKEDVNLASVDI